MKLIYTLLFLIFMSSNAFSQAVNAEFEQDHRSNGPNEIPLYEGTLARSGDSYRFGEGDDTVLLANPLSISISENSNKVGAIEADGGATANIYDYNGRELLSERMEFAELTDETIRITALNNGEFIFRDNVANFSFVDASGNRAYTYSNSSGASGGEQPSGISVSTAGELVVAYNPVIRYGSNRGSMASVVLGDREANQLFSSQAQTIESLKVSDNGAFVGAITVDDEGSARFLQFDRFGNELLELNPGMELTGFTLSGSGEFVTLVSGNRMQVYSALSGERLGSATSRSRVLKAAYFPEENLIVSIGGRHRGKRISNPEITAVDIEQRKIERHQLDGEISFSDHLDVEISRLNAGRYRVSGLNKSVLVNASF